MFFTRPAFVTLVFGNILCIHSSPFLNYITYQNDLEPNFGITHYLNLRERRSGLKRNSSMLWTKYHDSQGNYILPYKMDPSVEEDDSLGRMIEETMKIIEEGTCIQFKPKTSKQSDYIQFQVTAKSVPRILKLLCYKIGMDNEELRADRNKYVTILSKNVLPEAKSRFKVDSKNRFETYGIGYDFNSIMHSPYNVYQRAPNLVTIEPKPAYEHNLHTMGHAKTLSEKDIRLINHMYECSNKNGEGDKADEGEANDDEPDMPGGKEDENNDDDEDADQNEGKEEEMPNRKRKGRHDNDPENDDDGDDDTDTDGRRNNDQENEDEDGENNRGGKRPKKRRRKGGNNGDLPQKRHGRRGKDNLEADDDDEDEDGEKGDRRDEDPNKDEKADDEEGNKEDGLVGKNHRNGRENDDDDMDDGVDDLDDERKDDDHDKEPNGRHRADNDGHNAGDLIIGGSGIKNAVSQIDIEEQNDRRRRRVNDFEEDEGTDDYGSGRRGSRGGTRAGRARLLDEDDVTATAGGKLRRISGRNRNYDDDENASDREIGGRARETILPPGTRLAILPENEGADYPIYDESLDDENTIDGELLPCQDRADDCPSKYYLCKDGDYIGYFEELCPMTCQSCDFSDPDNPVYVPYEIRWKSYGCKDLDPQHCRYNRKNCALAGYKNFMIENCAITCKQCPEYLRFYKNGDGHATGFVARKPTNRRGK